ncbi:MAG: hypothetical protein H6631_17725 [Anaerolineaceae bacterium]|nr:hypothetical protein [Anaerolineaceae bacterium]MCB9102008.1 hypothetical protein [Anaerolineales bacterium]
MKQYPNLTTVIIHLSVQGLILIIFIAGLGCGLTLNLAPRLSGLMSEPASSRTWRQVRLPTLTPTLALVSEASHTGSTRTAAQLPAQGPGSVASPSLVSNVAPPAAQVDYAFADFRPIQAGSQEQTPSATPWRSDLELVATSTPTNTPVFTATSGATITPTPIANAGPTQTPLPSAALLPSPTAIFSPTPTPWPGYDFMLAEFYNSPTTNSFLLIYVAVVDPNEIPIGDMKIVGVRLDHHLTYESPLTAWYYEGYNAPSEHIKSGNVKFEPPGGIETTSWVLHLEDDHGQRQSEDVPFDVDETNKQWYFIKFRRKF